MAGGVCSSSTVNLGMGLENKESSSLSTPTGLAGPQEFVEEIVRPRLLLDNWPNLKVPGLLKRNAWPCWPGACGESNPEQPSAASMMGCTMRILSGRLA